VTSRHRRVHSRRLMLRAAGQPDAVCGVTADYVTAGAYLEGENAERRTNPEALHPGRLLMHSRESNGSLFKSRPKSFLAYTKRRLVFSGTYPQSAERH
jgi:hypothetical protein